MEIRVENATSVMRILEGMGYLFWVVKAGGQYHPRQRMGSGRFLRNRSGSLSHSLTRMVLTLQQRIAPVAYARAELAWLKGDATGDQRSALLAKPALKSLKARLSFTPGFSPVIRGRRDV